MTSLYISEGDEMYLTGNYRASTLTTDKLKQVHQPDNKKERYRKNDLFPNKVMSITINKIRKIPNFELQSNISTMCAFLLQKLGVGKVVQCTFQKRIGSESDSYPDSSCKAP